VAKLDGLEFPLLDSGEGDWLERRAKKRKSIRWCLVWMLSVKICRKGKEMEAAASLYYSTLFDLIQTTKYIGQTLMT
jgi:hypothetical protein